MAELARLGVGTRPFFWGLHEQPVLKKYRFYKEEIFPVCENLSRNGFYIPSGLALTENQMLYVVEKVKQVIRN